MKLRINKLISDAGLGSRRDVEEYIRRGRVKINGRVAHLGDLVSEEDVVFFDEVDLPVKELIRDHVAEEKLQARQRQEAERPRTKSRQAERAESQRPRVQPYARRARITLRTAASTRLVVRAGMMRIRRLMSV